MLRRFRQKVTLHELSVYILTRGLVLTALFLLSALVLQLCSDTWLAARYVEYLVSTGAVLLGAVLLGGLLLEDVLRKSG